MTPLPKNAAYLGLGGTFAFLRPFQGWVFRCNQWVEEKVTTVYGTHQYAAPLDSKVVRENLPKLPAGTVLLGLGGTFPFTPGMNAWVLPHTMGEGEDRRFNIQDTEWTSTVINNPAPCFYFAGYPAAPKPPMTNLTTAEAIALLQNARGPVSGLEFSNDDKTWCRLTGAGDPYCLQRVVVNGLMTEFWTRYASWRYCRKIVEPALTPDEIKAIKTLYPKATHIAWDMDGDCFVYTDTPKRLSDSFCGAAALRLSTLDRRWKGNWKDSVTPL